MEAPDSITCVDCGGQAGRLGDEPEDGFEPGDVVAYRCRDCLDRWDVVLAEDDEQAAADERFRW